MNIATTVQGSRNGQRSGTRLWLVALLGSLALGMHHPAPAAAAGRPPRTCAAQAHAPHAQRCPRPTRRAIHVNYWYVDADAVYHYVDLFGDDWRFNQAYGVLSYVDPRGHQWLADLSAHLYYLDPAGRLWYVDPYGRFWYADPYGRFWFYIDRAGHYGFVTPDAAGDGGSGYVGPSYGSGSGDPRFSGDTSGNWVSSLPADSGTIGVVDGCVSYIPSAGSGDDQSSYQGGNC
jgi:hypothetical protein